MSADTKTPLPVREKYTPAELALLSAWMDDHGDDPQEWPEPIRLLYAATIAAMRAGGAL